MRLGAGCGRLQWGRVLGPVFCMLFMTCRAPLGQADDLKPAAVPASSSATSSSGTSSPSPAPSSSSSANGADPAPLLPPRAEPLQAGEGGTERVFGRQVEIASRDRRHTRALSLGLSLTAPAPNGITFLPGASLYWLAHREDDALTFRGISVLFYNDLMLRFPLHLGRGASWADAGRWSGYLTFESETYPILFPPLADRMRMNSEGVFAGRMMPGFGIGKWRALSPHELRARRPEHRIEWSIHYKPSFRYFLPGSEIDARFALPQNHLENRLTFRVRQDRLVRNLMDLALQGMAFGLDGFVAHRSAWRTWGFPGLEGSQPSSLSFAVSSYFVGATRAIWGVPGRHAWIGALRLGVGGGLDRFNGYRLGGGPTGDEQEAISRTVVPGLGIEELQVSKYFLAQLERRFEILFFTFFSIKGGVAVAELTRNSRIDSLPFVGLGLTSGFLWSSRLTMNWAYNLGAVRLDANGNSGRGTHEWTIDCSKGF